MLAENKIYHSVYIAFGRLLCFEFISSSGRLRGKTAGAAKKRARTGDGLSRQN